MQRSNITKINFIKINLTNYRNTGATPPSVLAELGAFELSPPPFHGTSPSRENQRERRRYPKRH